MRLHMNLYHHAERKDVYATMQKDFNQDTWLQSWWHAVFVGCTFGATVVSDHLDWLWIFGGLYALERAIVRFIDNSNRNWFLHAVDWQETGWSSEKSGGDPTGT